MMDFREEWLPVLRMVAQGWDDEMIAVQLVLAERAVVHQIRAYRRWAGTAPAERLALAIHLLPRLAQGDWQNLRNEGLEAWGRVPQTTQSEATLLLEQWLLPANRVLPIGQLRTERLKVSKREWRGLFTMVAQFMQVPSGRWLYAVRVAMLYYAATRSQPEQT